MAWEWSHTIEGISYAQEQVQKLSKRTLLTILREWAYHDREVSNILRFRPIQHADGTWSNPQVWTDAKGKTRVRGFRLPNGLRKLHQDTLADLVWTRMEDHRTCSNGGYEAYCCPDGCHTVSFGPEE